MSDLTLYRDKIKNPTHECIQFVYTARKGQNGTFFFQLKLW